MNKKQFWVLVALMGVFFAAGLFRLNDLSLSTDSTRYLIWGNSLAHFDGYVDDTRPVPTRFVMNAPLYPLLLVPVEAVLPMSLTAAKVWTLVWAAVGLALFFLWLRNHFGFGMAIAAVAFLAFNPLFLIVSSEVLSEAPFLLFSILIFWMMDRFLTQEADSRTRWTLLVALALVTLLREVGASLVVAAVIIFFRRKNSKEFLIAGVSAFFIYLLWSLRNMAAGGSESGEATNVQFLFGRVLTGATDSIVSEFEARFWANLKGYVLQIGGAIVHPLPEYLVVEPSGFYEIIRSSLAFLRPAVTVIGLGMVAYGIKLDNSTPGGLFRLISLFFYLLIVLLYPVHDIRFLLPILPLLFFYTLRSADGLSKRRIPEQWRTKAGVGLVVLLIAPNVVTDYEILATNMRYRSAPQSFAAEADDALWFGQPWSEAGRWIRDNTPEEIVLASPAKEIAAFVGNRKVLETSRSLPTPIFERIVRDNSATYVLTTVVWDDMETFEIAMMESGRFWFEPVHSVANLTVYRVHSSLLNPRQDGLGAANPDTTTVKGRILAGRMQLSKLRYENAIKLFNAAMLEAPGQPEPVFQLMTVLSILGDSASTMQLNERLFTLPQSTAYSQLAQSTIGAMEQLLRAERQTIPQRSYTAFEAGLAYWSLGYGSTALAVMRNITKTDSTHFAAPLWGCYYARQQGDTTESNEFLKRLKRIDVTAPIIGDWETMSHLEERLKTTRAPEERARLHLRISRIYERLELFD
ncbi:MAG TPA: hypothetical protein VGA55_03535, partial [Bacteroidota bacterium]